MDLCDFDEALRACSDDTSEFLANGTRFIRKLPGKPPRSYLHVLYAPLPPESRLVLEQALGKLDPDFAEFLAFANGAALFDATVAIFGFGGNVSRSVRPEDQAAISVLTENQLFAAGDPERWSKGWRRIGSLVGWSSRWFIDLHRSGGCEVRSEEGGAAAYASFNELLGIIVGRLSPCFTRDGLGDESCQELEAALTSLVYLG